MITRKPIEHTHLNSMALQFSQQPSYQMHMFGVSRDYKDINRTYSPKGSNPGNSCYAKMLPNLPGFDGFSSIYRSDSDNSTASSLTDWTRKNPQEWTKKDVLDWIYYLVDQERLDGSKFKGEAYRSFVGRDLCGMSRDQFLEVDACYGNIIYDNFQCLLQQESVKNEKSSPSSGHIVPELLNENFTEQCWIDENNNVNSDNATLETHVNEVCDNSHTRYSSDLTILQTDSDIKVDIPSLGVYPISQEFELPCTPYNSSGLPSQPSNSFQQAAGVSPSLISTSMPTIRPWDMSSSEDSISAARAFLKLGYSCSPVPFQFTPSSSTHTSATSPEVQSLQGLPSAASSHSPSCSSLSRNFSTISTNSSDLEFSSEDSSCSLSFMPPMGSPNRGDAFSSDDIAVGINSSSTQLSELKENTTQQGGGRVKTAAANKTGNQLWKFVLELLRDPEANPRLLKWEDRNSGVFRFIQSEKVAKLWGLKKNNPLMTYEKMSRAMRFCRSVGYFSEIEKDGRFPKKLCFKFGMKSLGWRD